MTEKQYEVFFDILDQLVNRGNSSWQERKEELVSNASERDLTNLNEIAAWIQED